MSEIKDSFGRPWAEEDVLSCVGPGWRPLVKKLIEDLFAGGWDGTLAQVKEKFGGLRFYHGGCSEELFQLTLEAENESYKICEDCGAPGKIWPGWDWLRTQCESCNLKRWEAQGPRMVDGAAKTYDEWIKSIPPED